MLSVFLRDKTIMDNVFQKCIKIPSFINQLVVYLLVLLILAYQCMATLNPFKKYDSNSPKGMKLNQQTVDKPSANKYEEKHEHPIDFLNAEAMRCHDNEISNKSESDLAKNSPIDVLQSNDPYVSIRDIDAPAVSDDLDLIYFRRMLNLHSVNLVANGNKCEPKSMQSIKDLMEMFNNNKKPQVSKVFNEGRKLIIEGECADTTVNSSNLDVSKINDKNLSIETNSQSVKKKRPRKKKKKNFQVNKNTNDFHENKVIKDFESSTVKSIPCNSENYSALNPVDASLIKNDVINIPIESAFLMDSTAQTANSQKVEKANFANNEQAVLNSKTVELKPTETISNNEQAVLNSKTVELKPTETISNNEQAVLNSKIVELIPCETVSNNEHAILNCKTVELKPTETISNNEQAVLNSKTVELKPTETISNNEQAVLNSKTVELKPTETISNNEQAVLNSKTVELKPTETISNNEQAVLNSKIVELIPCETVSNNEHAILNCKTVELKPTETISNNEQAVLNSKTVELKPTETISNNEQAVLNSKIVELIPCETVSNNEHAILNCKTVELKPPETICNNEQAVLNSKTDELKPTEIIYNNEQAVLNSKIVELIPCETISNNEHIVLNNSKTVELKPPETMSNNEQVVLNSKTVKLKPLENISNNEQAIPNSKTAELKLLEKKSYAQIVKKYNTVQGKVFGKSKILSIDETSFILDGNTEIKRTCCFLFGVSLATVSLINIFKLDQVLEFELKKNGSIEEYWIGISSCNEKNYNLLKEYCRQYKVNSITKCALFELTNYVPDDCAPIPMTLDESMLVSI